MITWLNSHHTFNVFRAHCVSHSVYHEHICSNLCINQELSSYVVHRFTVYMILLSSNALMQMSYIFVESPLFYKASDKNSWSYADNDYCYDNSITRVNTRSGHLCHISPSIPNEHLLGAWRALTSLSQWHWLSIKMWFKLLKTQRHRGWTLVEIVTRFSLSTQ